MYACEYILQYLALITIMEGMDGVIYSLATTKVFVEALSSKLCTLTEITRKGVYLVLYILIVSKSSKNKRDRIASGS